MQDEHFDPAHVPEDWQRQARAHRAAGWLVLVGTFVVGALVLWGARAMYVRGQKLAQAQAVTRAERERQQAAADRASRDQQLIAERKRAERERERERAEREAEAKKPTAEKLRTEILHNNDAMALEVRIVTQLHVELLRGETLIVKSKPGPELAKYRATLAKGWSDLEQLRNSARPKLENLSRENIIKASSFRYLASKEELRDEFPVAFAFCGDDYCRVSYTSSRDGRDWSQRMAER